MLPAQEVILSAESSGTLEEVEFVWNENESGSMMTVYENGSYDLYAKYNEGNVEYIEQIEVVEREFDRLGVDPNRVILVYNKIDKMARVSVTLGFSVKN